MEEKLRQISRWLNGTVRVTLYGLLRAFTKALTPKRLLFGIGDTSYTDGETLQVQLMESEVEKYEKPTLFRILKFKLYHEGSHVLWTTDKFFEKAIMDVYEVFRKEAEAQGFVLAEVVVMKVSHYLINSLEDGRIENILCIKYRGLKKHRDWYRLLEMSERELAEEVFSDLMTAILSVATTGMLVEGFEEYYEGTEMYEALKKCIPHISKFVSSGTLEKAVPEAVEIAEIIKKFFIEYAKENGAALPEEMLEQLKNINENNFGHNNEQEAQNGPIIAILTDEQQKGEKSEGETKKPDIIIDLRKNPPKSDEENTEGNETDGNKSSGLGARIKQAIKEIEEDTLNDVFQEMKNINEGDKILEEQKAKNETRLDAKDISDIADVVGDFNFSERKMSEFSYTHYTEAPGDISAIGTQNRYKIQQILECKKEMDRLDCLDGEINPYQLDKFLTGQPDFFMKEGSEVIPEGCVFILKDNSDSMYGEKERLAIKALSAIEESVKGLLPTKISAFEAGGRTEQQTVIKDWEDNDPSVNYSYSYHRSGYGPNGGNEDGWSIMTAAKQLLKRPEENKLLIVVSDGYPARPELVTAAVRWARQQGIFLCSFFIAEQERELDAMEETFKLMYENYFTGVTADNLSASLYNFIREFVNSMN